VITSSVHGAAISDRFRTQLMITRRGQNRWRVWLNVPLPNASTFVGSTR
jgi:hypothetical protein